jgi:glyoxylase-like metal-dependent hydrolase (beta-lactamase superfamily II)
VYATRTAWTSVRGRSRTSALSCGFLPALVPNDIEDRLSFVEDAGAIALGGAFAPFGAARDLFGDRSILAVGLPGHAVGHIGLAVLDAPRGPWFFVGDAAWSSAAIRDARPPPRITTALLGNTRAYRTTLRDLGALARADPSLRIVPAHDAHHE